jgi:hypothetical protein
MKMQARGSGCIDRCILDFGTNWNSVVSFTSRLLYQLNMRLDGPQNRSRWCGEGVESCPYQGLSSGSSAIQPIGWRNKHIININPDLEVTSKKWRASSRSGNFPAGFCCLLLAHCTSNFDSAVASSPVKSYLTEYVLSGRATGYVTLKWFSK